jgi:hypothetical protein
MELYYDERDDSVHEARGSRILYWLDDLGAKPLADARSHSTGFLFAGARSLEDYQRLVNEYPLIRDRPAERAPLLRLDTILRSMARKGITISTPRTWEISLDASLPDDLTFPLFVRTAHTSLKLGGKTSRVATSRQLEEEITLLRRLLGWDALILAREWRELAVAGQGTRGPIPQEIRTWIVDGDPYAWSFHYMDAVSAPKGFPPSRVDLETLRDLGKSVASAFQSRCVVADFAKEETGQWLFIEAGPGSCAGTSHEDVFKAVAAKLLEEEPPAFVDAVGGLF